MNKTLFPVACLALWAAHAVADPGAPAFSGRIEGGAAFVSTTDRLFARGDREIDGLGDAGEASAAGLPVALFDLRYRSASGTEFYLGTPLETTTVRLSLGAAQPLGRLGTLELAGVASPWADAWEDPYLVGADRTATRAPEYGGKAAWTGIAGTGLGVSYTGLRTDVDQDEAGERLPELRRSGWTHEGGVGYRFSLGPRASLTPALAATQGDLDGGAEAFRRYEARLSGRLVRESFLVNAFLTAGRTRYRKEHPLFGERRREGTAGAAAIVTVPKLLGRPRLYSNLVASYGVRSADLGFFDARTALMAATLGYSL